MSTSRRRTRAASKADLPSLPAPEGLGVTVFELEGEQYALFSFDLPDSELPANLTPAERVVARLALEGLSNADIARARRTSVNTVANQLRCIYEKLGVAGRSELVRQCRGGGSNQPPAVLSTG